MMNEFLNELAQNFDFVSDFIGYSVERVQILGNCEFSNIFCPTCDNIANPTDGRCPKVFNTYPPKIYVTKHHYYPYVRFFENIDAFRNTLSGTGSSAENMRNIWSNTGSVVLVCPRNLEEFLGPIKALQVEFHPDSTIYNNYEILIERMTKFHDNVWSKSPYMGNGIEAKILNKYPDAINSPILREIIHKEAMSFNIAQDRILDQIRVEVAFPELRLR